MGAALIFHVPRPNVAKPASTDANTICSSQGPQQPVTTDPVPAVPISAIPVATTKVSTVAAPAYQVPSGEVASIVESEPRLPQSDTRVAVNTAPVTNVTARAVRPKQTAKSNSTKLTLIPIVAVILIAATFFFVRRHRSSSEIRVVRAVQTPAATVAVAPAATTSSPASANFVPADASPGPTSAVSQSSENQSTEKVTPDDAQPAQARRKFGTLVIIAGQDGARVLLNGKIQAQPTEHGQLRLPNLELKDYIVQVSKSGFRSPPAQRIRIHKDEEAQLIFDLQPAPEPQPQPHLASLVIAGGVPGTTILVDQTPVGAVQDNGTFSVSTISAGDHTVELRKQQFQPRQIKKHFVDGETTSLSPADVALEAAAGELKINFAPADATVAVVKGALLKVVNSGVPFNLAAGSYTLTARTSERFTRSATIDVVPGQSRTLDLSLAPNGMSKWDDPGAWKHEKDVFTHKGGEFVLYGVTPASGTFVFSAMITKGRLLQWVLDYTDPRNYVLFQIDENNFYRAVIRNGQKTDEIKIPDKADKKSYRTFQVRVSANELVHQVRHGDSWTVLDRWAQTGTNLSQGKFGFYIPGEDQVALSSFAHYAELNVR
jgi:hypothetical protein